MKNNIGLGTYKVAGLFTLISAGIASGVAPANAVNLIDLQDSSFNFNDTGNAIIANNVIDFTKGGVMPPSPGEPGLISIATAKGGFQELFADENGMVTGTTAEIKDLAVPTEVTLGKKYDFNLTGFYDNFTKANGEKIDIRFDLTGFTVNAFPEPVASTIIYNFDGFIVSGLEKLPVNMSFTTLSAEIDSSDPQPSELGFYATNGEIPTLDINSDDVIDTGFSGQLETDAGVEQIPEPMTMLGSAAAIGFGYFSKKRRAAK